MSETRATTCGHPIAPSVSSKSGVMFTLGYALTLDGQILCYSCADDKQRTELETETFMGGYLSSDGKRITTWTDGALMRVTQHGESRTGFYDSTIHYVRAIDPSGAFWYGKNGGPGMYVTMHKCV